jgi:hypothetical protein
MVAPAILGLRLPGSECSQGTTDRAIGALPLACAKDRVLMPAVILAALPEQGKAEITLP